MKKATEIIAAETIMTADEQMDIEANNFFKSQASIQALAETELGKDTETSTTRGKMSARR